MSKLYATAITALRKDGFTDEQISRELEISMDVIAEYPGSASPKKCGNCATPIETDVGQCAQCGRIFSALAQPFDVSAGPSLADWRASVSRAAATERANESAVKRGGDVQTHPGFLSSIKEALQGVVSPSQQLGDE